MLSPQNEITRTSDGWKDVVLPLRHVLGGGHEPVQRIKQLPRFGREGHTSVGSQEGNLSLHVLLGVDWRAGGVEAGARARGQDGAIREDRRPSLQLVLVVGGVQVGGHGRLVTQQEGGVAGGRPLQAVVGHAADL